MADLDQWLSIEAENHLWEPEVRGISLWALIRYTALVNLINEATGVVPYMEAQRHPHPSWQRLGRYGRTLRLMADTRHRSFSSLFIITNLSRYSLDNDTSFDRLYGEYYNALKNPLIFESSATDYWAKPDPVYEANIYMQNVMSNWAYAASKLVRISAVEQRHIREFVQHVAALYQVSNGGHRLQAQAVALLKRYDELRLFLHRMIVPHVEVHFAVMECASYTGREALINHILHEVDFTVAEVQHGNLSVNHPAYNFPEALITDAQHPARRYLPDLFFTYGAYWSTQVRIPAQKVEIGNPNLTESVQKYLANASLKSKQILILSGLIGTDDLALAVAEALPEYTIIFKLHPSENDLFDSYSAKLKLPNIRVVNFVNVYELIAQSEIVISYASTVLIEAVAFPGKRIFYNNRHWIPPEIGDYFEDANDLIAQIKDVTRGQPRCDPGVIWPSDYRERLTAYFASIPTAK